jgi:hypothetical protein
MVERELDEDREWMALLDRRVFLTYYQMGQGLGGKVVRELVERYEFHLVAQQLLRDLAEHNANLEGTLGYLQEEGSLPYEVFHLVRNALLKAHDALARTLATADKWPVPVLQHLSSGEPLAHFLLEKRLLKGLRPHARVLTGKWIGKFMRQFGEVLNKLRRIHFKSLGGILALQEQIGQRWRPELADMPEAVVESETPAPPDSDDSEPFYRVL